MLGADRERLRQGDEGRSKGSDSGVFWARWTVMTSLLAQSRLGRPEKRCWELTTERMGGSSGNRNCNLI